jgi:hypothetical protein
MAMPDTAMASSAGLPLAALGGVLILLAMASLPLATRRVGS